MDWNWDLTVKLDPNEQDSMLKNEESIQVWIQFRVFISKRESFRNKFSPNTLDTQNHFIGSSCFKKSPAITDFLFAWKQMQLIRAYFLINHIQLISLGIVKELGGYLISATFQTGLPLEDDAVLDTVSVLRINFEAMAGWVEVNESSPSSKRTAV